MSTWTQIQAHDHRPLGRQISTYESLVAAEASLDGTNSEEVVDAVVAATCATEKAIVDEPNADMRDVGAKLVWLGGLVGRHAAHGVPKLLLPALVALHADVLRLSQESVVTID